MQMRHRVSFFTHQQAKEHGLKVPVLWTGKKASKVLQVVAQSFILTYNRMKHEILLDNFFDFILLYHELLMLSTFLPFWKTAKIVVTCAPANTEQGASYSFSHGLSIP